MKVQTRIKFLSAEKSLKKTTSEAGLKGTPVEFLRFKFTTW